MRFSKMSSFAPSYTTGCGLWAAPNNIRTKEGLIIDKQCDKPLSVYHKTNEDPGLEISIWIHNWQVDCKNYLCECTIRLSETYISYCNLCRDEKYTVVHHLTVAGIHCQIVIFNWSQMTGLLKFQTLIHWCLHGIGWTGSKEVMNVRLYHKELSLLKDEPVNNKATNGLLTIQPLLSIVCSMRESEWDIKFISLFGDRGHRGPYSPCKLCSHNL